MWTGSLCLAKSFNVPVLSFHMNSAQQAELPESFSRRAHCCLVQEQTGCGNLSSDLGPESVLDTLGCFYLVIRHSMILFAWSQVSLGTLGLGGPNQVHSNCLLRSLSPPPKTDAGGERTKPFPPGGVSR